ncbi:hypothetical protein K488DRAFT_22394, partial [Vararia minispora EC-137]
SNNSLYAAITRTLTRGAALYFSRPVRLFRPAKVSGWTSLRGLALRNGRQVDSSFLRELVQAKGLIVIPKHFVPPLLVNAVLGTVLWTTYVETSNHLAKFLDPMSAALLAGGVAGGTQALVAAPADNIRLAIECGSGGWSHAWKEVFRGTEAPNSLASRVETLGQARRVRDWVRELGDTAGRGWHGWRWTVLKDFCGFSVFFAVFEGTRRVASTTASICQDIIRPANADANTPHGMVVTNAFRENVPRFVHGLTLVTGGVCAGLAYELVCRPWDVVRRLVHLDHINSTVTHTSRHYLISIVSRRLREEGPLYFFKPPYHHPVDCDTTSARRRLNIALRALGRVGPWGVGFLVWEAFGDGLA